MGDTTERAAGGGDGYKLIGIALGVAIHSQPFGMALGAAGASRSLYIHFIARGREAVVPHEHGNARSASASAPRSRKASATN